MATYMRKLLEHFKKQGMNPTDAMKAANKACVSCILRENPVVRQESGQKDPDSDAA